MGILLATSAAALPIRVNQPTAVTPASASQLTSEQIDYLLKHYVASERLTRASGSRHEYVPIDSAYIKSTDPKLRQPQAAASATHSTTITKANNGEEIGDTAGSDSDSYFMPTVRPYSPANPSVYDFYFPQSEDGSGGVQFGDEDTVDVTVPSNLAYLRQMQPPQQPSDDDEPNYYAALQAAMNEKQNTDQGKSKKRPASTPKKFNASKKLVNLNGGSAAIKASTLAKMYASEIGAEEEYNAAMQNQGYVAQASGNREVVFSAESEGVDGGGTSERRTPKSAIRKLRADELNTGEYLPSVLRNGNASGQRIAYQMHGFNGPQSYRFGFDTGKG